MLKRVLRVFGKTAGQVYHERLVRHAGLLSVVEVTRGSIILD